MKEIRRGIVGSLQSKQLLSEVLFLTICYVHQKYKEF